MCDGFCPQSRPLLQPLRGDTARFGLLDGIVSGIQEATKEVTVQHVLVPTKDKAASVFAGVKECGVESIGRFAQEASECGSAKKRPDAKMSQLRGEPGELSFRRGQMAKEFESVAFEAPLKVVQEPFKTQFGWHVMVVNKRTGEETPATSSVQSTVPAPIVDGDVQVQPKKTGQKRTKGTKPKTGNGGFG